MSYIETVRHFVIENFLFGDGENVKDNTPFLEAGIIDSTGILELIMFIEGTFGVKVEDNELIPENLGSVNNVAEYLDRKVSSISA